MEQKLVGVYFYDNDPGEGEGAERYLIHALLWPKNARGAGRVWHADCTKVVQKADSGEWVPHLGESSEPETQVYYVNDGLYQMIEAGWDLNDSKLRRVGPPDAEGEAN